MTPAEWMASALSLAEKARGNTSPNPMVGAILVKEERIAGEGYHRQAGQPHAEIEALNQAGGNAEGSTLYVNLEPCCHHGKTPPCTDALIAARIKKVVAAIRDPNPAVSGKGIKALEEAGIEVEVGLLEAEARQLNEVFFKWVVSGFPFVVLKYAMTLDGKIATSTGDSRWITGKKSRERVHEMRHWYDAILVGINTVLKDDPLLTCRVPNGKNPIRIILDSRLRIPLDSRIMKTVSDSQTWIIASSGDREKKEELERNGASVLGFPEYGGKVDLMRLCAYLGENNVTSLLVEGGARVHGTFLNAGLADKMAIFIGPKLVGDHGAIGPVDGWGKALMREALRLKEIKNTLLDEDVLIEGYL